MESQELIKQNNNICRVEDIKSQIDMITQLYRSVMIKDEHYGKIPGTQKDTLYKAGAEKLIQMFRLSPQIEKEQVNDLGNRHREYSHVVGLYHRVSGELWGHGCGTCSTLESKYKYKWVNKPKPSNAEELKLSGKGKWKRNGSDWQWQERHENPDIADTYNTVMKMSYKRAVVAAVIIVTGVSDIFTQDMEDHVIEEPEPKKKGISTDEVIKRLDLCNGIESLTKTSERISKEYSLTCEQKKTLTQFFNNKKDQLLKSSTTASAKEAMTSGDVPMFNDIEPLPKIEEGLKHG